MTVVNLDLTKGEHMPDPQQLFLGSDLNGQPITLIAQSPLAGRYDKPIDRESAYEVLMARRVAVPTDSDVPVKGAQEESSIGSQAGAFLGSLAGQTMKTAMRQAANQIGRQLVRGLMGSLLGDEEACVIACSKKAPNRALF
jgi:hypothetical protein